MRGAFADCITSTLFTTALLFDAPLLLFRLLARNLLEHDLQPFADHSLLRSCGSTMVSIALMVSGWYPRRASAKTRFATCAPAGVFNSASYSGAISLRRPTVCKYSSRRGKPG